MDFLAASRVKNYATAKTNNEKDQTVRSLNEGFEERYRSLHQEFTTLQDQHKKLKEHLTAMQDTVRVLGDQSSQTTKVAQQAQSSKLDLLEKHAKLQEQCKGLMNSVQTLGRSFEAANEKLFLQNQLHENKLRTMEATHNTLKERCKTAAAATEQHRLGSLQLEARNRSMAKDIERLTELHASALKAKDGEAQARLSKVESDLTQLRITHARLQSETVEVPSLKAKIESHATEARRLQAKIRGAESLLKSHPIDPSQSAKAKSILSSSAEILELARAKGSVEEMRQCLGQVAGVLKDLSGQLGVQCKLSKAWLDQVDNNYNGRPD